MVKGNLEVSRYFEKKKKLQPYSNQSNLQLFPFNYRKRRNSRIAINCKVFIKIVVNEKWKLHNGLTERMRYVSAKVCNKILFCFSHKYPTSSFFSKLGFFIRNVFWKFFSDSRAQSWHPNALYFIRLILFFNRFRRLSFEYEWKWFWLNLVVFSTYKRSIVSNLDCFNIVFPNI